MPFYKISIKFNRLRKIYKQGEHIKGVIVIENKYNLRHEGIFLTMDGLVEMNPSLKSINLIDTFTNSNKAIKLVDFTYELRQPASFSPGQHKIP